MVINIRLVQNKRTNMAEYLINTINRHDNYMANLLLLQGEIWITLIYPYCESRAWINSIRCRHFVSSASSHISKYLGQQLNRIIL